MIAIIDYGAGNLRSVQKALNYLGYRVLVTSNPQELLEADKVILPGVGAFGKSMENLDSAGVIPVVRQLISSGRPFLGICLGLQMLFTESEELFGGEKIATKGLGIFPGRVVRFKQNDLKVPQIGWNQIYKTKDSPILHGIADGSYVYFVHSYYVIPDEAGITACKTNYGEDYCSGIFENNVAAFQFHPEKSSQVGLKILKNFAELV